MVSWPTMPSTAPRSRGVKRRPRAAVARGRDLALEARAGVIPPAATAFLGKRDHAGGRRVKPPSGRLLRCRYGRAGDTPSTGVVLGDYAERKRPALERTRTPTTSSNRSPPEPPTSTARLEPTGYGPALRSRRGNIEGRGSDTGTKCGIISSAAGPPDRCKQDGPVPSKGRATDSGRGHCGPGDRRESEGAEGEGEQARHGSRGHGAGPRRRPGAGRGCDRPCRPITARRGLELTPEMPHGRCKPSQGFNLHPQSHFHLQPCTC